VTFQLSLLNTGNFTNYTISVTYGGKTWEMQKRFSEMQTFHDDLGKVGVKFSGVFPKKSMRLQAPTADSKLDSRRVKLNEWFAGIANQPLDANSQKKFDGFIQKRKNQRITKVRWCASQPPTCNL
jgi:hypothetical protein